MSDESAVKQVVADFAAIGFTGPASALETLERIEAVWGASISDIADNDAGRDLVVLTAAGAPIFDAGAEGYVQGERGYVDLIERCAALAPNHLSVEDVQEHWPNFDNVSVTFTANGVAYSCEPQRKYIDTSVLAVVNQAVAAESVGFWACDALGMPSIVAFLTHEQRAHVVTNRGWDLQPDLPNGDVDPKATTPVPSAEPPPPQADSSSKSWFRRGKR